MTIRLMVLLLVAVFSAAGAAAHDALPPQTTSVAHPGAEAIQIAELVPPLVDRSEDLPAKRPLSFSFLYVTSAALQGFDAYSTLNAVNDRATEQNPLINPVVLSPAGFLAVKAGVATLVILAAERLRARDHRVAAILLMLGSNGFMTYVAFNNARALPRR